MSYVRLSMESMHILEFGPNHVKLVASTGKIEIKKKQRTVR